MRHLLAITTFPFLLAACIGSPATAPVAVDPTPTPTATPAAEAPSVTSVSPTVASPAMRVWLTGAGFSAVAAENVVRVGGIVAIVESATETEIVFHPVAPAGVRGEAAITVTVNGLTSTPAAFQLAASGDVRTLDTRPHLAASSIAVLEDGTSFFLDAVRGTLRRIGGDGAVSVVASDLAEGTSSIVATPDGDVLLVGAFDALRLFSPADATVTVWRALEFPWTAAAWGSDSLYLLRSGGSGVDRIDGNGDLTAAVFPTAAGACDGASMIAAVDEQVFVATSEAVCVASASGIAEMALTGPQPATIRALAGGSSLLMAGSFYGLGEGAVLITAGQVTVHASVPLEIAALAPEAGGSIVASIGRGLVVRADMSNLSLLATPIDGVTSNLVVEGGNFVTGGFGGWDLAYLARVEANGTYSIVAHGSGPDIWTSLTADGEGFLVASLFESSVLRLAHGAPPETILYREGGIASVVRHGDSFLVSGWTEAVERWGSDGALADAAFVLVPGSAGGLLVKNETLWIAGGDRIMVASMSGGPATDILGPEAGFVGLSSVAVSSDGVIYVADGDETGAVLRLEGSDAVELQAGGAQASVTVDETGAVSVAVSTQRPFILFP